MNRNDFQQLADVRIAEAKLLVDNGMYDGAYYLAGYAVECALKACIAKLTNQYDFPPKVKIVSNFYTHNFVILLQSAGLKDLLDAAIDKRSNPASFDAKLAASWDIALQWNEESRYDRKTETEARDLNHAITDPTHGVLTWIKARW